MTHNGLWTAVDRAAAKLGLSPSGFAKYCGFDPTAFNPCKRTTIYGQPRWLSGRTIAIVIEKSGLTPAEFFALGSVADSQK